MSDNNWPLAEEVFPEDYLSPEALIDRDKELNRLYWEDQARKAEESLQLLDQRTFLLSGAEAVLFDRIRKWLHIPDVDEAVVEFALAAFVSHDLTGADPLWCLIVGASGGGKSELLRAFINLPNAFHLSKPTPNSLASGWRGGKGGVDPSLLPQMDGKVVITPDLAPLLSEKAENRNAVFGILREAFDGTFATAKGNLGRIIYKSKFSYITASTAAIDELGGEVTSLGERFIRIRFRSDEGISKSIKATDNVGHSETMRKELAACIAEFLKGLKGINVVKVSKEISREIAVIADATARARSTVYRDRYSREITNLPVPEEGGRLAIQFGKLLRSIAVVRNHPEPDLSDVAFIQRVADDCMPPIRLQIISQLRLKPSNWVSKNDLVAKNEVSQQTLSRTLEDLCLLKVTECDKSNYHDFKYRLKARKL